MNFVLFEKYLLTQMGNLMEIHKIIVEIVTEFYENSLTAIFNKFGFFPQKLEQGNRLYQDIKTIEMLYQCLGNISMIEDYYLMLDKDVPGLGHRQKSHPAHF